MLREPLHHAGVALLALSFSLLAAGHVAGQATLMTVGAGGGAGQYSDIQAAVDAAQPGDRIVVESGSYPGFTVTKGVAIIGKPGAQIGTFGSKLETLTVKNLPAGEICSVRGLALGGGTIGPLQIADCAGQVVLEGVVDAVPSTASRVITNSRQVVVNRCILTRLSVSGSSIVLTDSVVLGTAGVFGSPGLTLFSAIAHVSRCTVLATDALLPAPGILAHSSLLYVTGDGGGRIQAGTGGGAGKSAIDGTCTLFLDDDVALSPSGSAPAIAASVARTIAPIPSLSVAGEPIGSTVTVDLFAESGDTYVLLAGVLGNAVPVPLFGGQYWLHPLATVVVLTGTIDGTQRLGVTYDVPDDPVFVGITTGWQAVAAAAGAQFVLSNPATATYGL